MSINEYQRVRIRPKNEVEADQKQTRSRPEADQKQTRSRPKKKVEADQRQIDWNWNIVPAKNVYVGIMNQCLTNSFSIFSNCKGK